MNVDSISKSKFSKKLLAITLIVIIAIAVVVLGKFMRVLRSATKSEVTLPTMSLTLIGANGQQKTLNSNQLAALKSTTATGGYSEDWKDLCWKLHRSASFNSFEFSWGNNKRRQRDGYGSDGYQVTFTYQQVQGQGLTLMTQREGLTQPSQPLTVIVAYYCNGTSIASDKAPLTVAIVGSQGLFTKAATGHYFLVKIEVIAS